VTEIVEDVPKVLKVSSKTASSTSSAMFPTKTVFFVLVPSSMNLAKLNLGVISLGQSRASSAVFWDG
jgi:hypothetical protein